VTLLHASKSSPIKIEIGKRGKCHHRTFSIFPQSRMPAGSYSSLQARNLREKTDQANRETGDKLRRKKSVLKSLSIGRTSTEEIPLIYFLMQNSTTSPGSSSPSATVGSGSAVVDGNNDWRRKLYHVWQRKVKFYIEKVNLKA